MRKKRWLFYVLASSSLSFAALAGFSGNAVAAWNLNQFWSFFLAGIAYEQFFEYVWHRWPMHKRDLRVFGIAVFKYVLENHIEHHRYFNARNLTSDKEENLRHLASVWYFYPLTLASHCLIVFPLLSYPQTLVFFGGATVGYTIFETVHWFTHEQGTVVENFLLHIPFVGFLAILIKRHHLWHHTDQRKCFNFSLPWPFDWFFGTIELPPPDFIPELFDKTPLGFAFKRFLYRTT